MPSKFEKILQFIILKHEGQIDKGGNPYFLHPISVALSCQKQEEKIVALLHDVLEDTDASIDEIMELGISKEELDALLLLTKPKKEDYMHYIKRLAKNDIARKVKMADLSHNMDITRLLVVTEKDINRIEKYKKAYEFLSSLDKRAV